MWWASAGLLAAACQHSPVRRELVHSGARQEPNWFIDVPEQFVADLVGDEALATCRAAMEHDGVTSCTVFVPPCVNVIVQDGASFVDFASWGCARYRHDTAEHDDWMLTCGDQSCGTAAIDWKPPRTLAPDGQAESAPEPIDPSQQAVP